MRHEHTDVVIAGGGLVGLSMAAFLGWHGVRSVLVEQHGGISTHPRARGTNPRTMELLREVGLEGRVRATESARALAGNAGVIAVESLAGREIGELRQSYHQDSGADYSGLSPTTWCLCHQDELEPLLRDRAVELGAQVRFNARLERFEQDADEVRVEVRDLTDGVVTRLSADYLIGADGVGSTVRRQLGIPMPGPGVLARFLNIQFRADLREALGERRFIICYTTQAGTRCALLPIDNAYRWLLHVLDPGSELDEQQCVDLVRAAAGLPDLAVRVESVLPWDAAGAVAQRFRNGRVFLVGDAAHVMPPSGAFGSNTGIQDAHNLAWRIAAVSQRVASASLLDGYEGERRPVAEATVRQAVLRSKDRPRLVTQEAAPPDPEIQPDPVVIFGYRYPTATDAGGWQPQPDGAPGSRAPHCWLSTDDGQLSTLDLYGRTFVLLCGGQGGAWAEVLGRRSTVSAVAYMVHVGPAGAGPARRGPGDLHDPTGEFGSSHGIGPGGAVLVRPDGIVSWRAPAGPDDAAIAALDEALARLLGAAARAGH
jgi:putative polyketide hydroxylase